MTFEEILDQAVAMLQRRGRVTYRTLKRQFELDNDALEDLKAELIKGQRLAVDEEGEVLVWTGAPDAPPGSEMGAPVRAETRPAPATYDPTTMLPIAYTPRHLAERILAEQAALEARGTPDGERKTITALFADIKGSMDLLEDLDPEDARRLIDPALQLMMEAVHRYEGYVAQSLGDGIFALFGAPIAHEDHAQRALYAALRMQEAIKRHADKLRLEQGIPIQMRVGLNTGEVVVRAIRTDDLHTDYVPIGHSTSLAARMQSLAMPGSILVPEATYRLTEGYFAFKPLGAAQVKGVRQPVPIYEVLGVGPLRTRLQVSARRGLVRFVGRQGELEQMQRAWEQGMRGQGQIVAVVGEPGVGKSRLCYEFKLAWHRGCLLLETFSVSHGKAYPYLPLIELLRHYFQLTPLDDERRIREQVTGKVLTLDRSLEDTLPYLAALLGISEPAAVLAQMDPQIKRRRTFEAITRLLLRESLNQPLLLLVEDLHWLDSETEAWLNLLSDRIATARLLLLVNYRPEYRHIWGSESYYTQLRLNPLGREEAQELLTALLGDGMSLQPLKHLILAKTEGNPFFMEEIVQTLVDQGVLVRGGAAGVPEPSWALAQPLTDLQLPPTVQGVLAARIDRLPTDEKALLQMLAVIGKEFPFSLLMHVVEQPEDDVQRLLSRLQRGEFIYEQPAFPEPEYTFKHALTQEVAYASLLMERRRGLHERTAQAIEALFGDRLEEHYSELAHHYGRSGNTAKAVVYLQRAGQQAVQRSAYAEAIGDLTKALTLLQTLPETPERTQHELILQTSLGPALMATQGWASLDVEQIYGRARELCEQMGETPQLFPALMGLGTFYLAKGQLHTSRELREQLLSLAQRQQDPVLLLQAHLGLGATLLWRGEFAQARVHLEQAIALYHPKQTRALAFAGDDPGVSGRRLAALSLWLLGYPEQGLRRSQEALTLAQGLSHPFSLAFALTQAAIFHQLRRDGQTTHAQAEAVMTLSGEQGYPHFVAMGTILRGWALAEHGLPAEGVAQIHQGLAAWRIAGQELARPYYLALLAEAYGRAGQAEEGLSVLEEALTVAHTNRDCFYEAELYRLKGELLLSQAGRVGSRTVPAEPTMMVEAKQTVPSEPETCFQQALAVARSQQAKSLELRAAMSLSRLWQQGKPQEARQLLAEIYGWFYEGFDTADLQEAKALLEALSR
jgi:class 3 adenylate cyclase/predicted ATPase